MKRALTIAFSTLMLCSLLLATAGIANAGNMDYTMTEHWGAVEPTIDGTWSSADEWTDGQPVNMTDDEGRFVYKMLYDTFSMYWLIEYFNDTTDDAGDIWQICFDDSNGGGAAPQAGDFKIEITGHTTLKAYEGTGSGWSEIDADEISWSDGLVATQWDSTPHWMLEVSDVKTDGLLQVANAPPTGLYMAAYDADTDTWVSWAPDATADVPDDWGVIDGYDQNPWVPEGFSIVVVVLLSSIAVAVGVYFMHKRPKIESYTPTTGSIR